MFYIRSRFNLKIRFHMKLSISHQEHYSRIELILRTLFGFIYITLPHSFLLFFLGLWSLVLTFVSFVVVLITGEYPESIFEFQTQLMRWKLRVNSRLFNLSDGYPAFGLSATDNYTEFEVPYPEKISRGLVLLRFFFGFLYVALPHGIILFFRILYGVVLSFIAWLSVLFLGKFPKNFHNFLVGNIRWQYRVALYLCYMTDEYPPFTGKELNLN